jgi:hypothetical protein
MDHNQRKQDSTIPLPNLGWLFMSEEERRLLLAYVELALNCQFGGERSPQDRLSGEVTLEHIGEARNASADLNGAERG